jgi:hypothetical protein
MLNEVKDLSVKGSSLPLRMTEPLLKMMDHPMLDTTP